MSPQFSKTVEASFMKLLIVALTFLAVWLHLSVCQPDMERRNRPKRGEGGKKRGAQNSQIIALETWADSLTDRDFNYTEWRKMYHSSSTVDFFNGYARKISKIFKDADAKVNFAMVGACDGTGDNTIKHLYLPNEHWRGVFVEPMGINVRDLIKYMSDKNVSHRSLIIQAAATLECEGPTLTVERPLYEEKNASLPHWLRRQIGSVLPKHRDHARKEWTTEVVRCVTAADILADWASSSAGNKAKKPLDEYETKKKRRPHILKIDVEGHDFEVLMSFLDYNTPVTELPLIIDFEAKSIAKKYPTAKERMEFMGYVVSPFGQDGFAILSKEKLLDSIALEKKQLQKNAKARKGKGPKDFA